MNSREAFRNYLKTGARIGESMEKTFKAGFLSGLASQQDHIGDSNKLVNKVVFDSESARQFLIESVLPKFSDSTFQKYVLEELAGDFAYQLAMYLASQAQQSQAARLLLLKLEIEKICDDVKYAKDAKLAIQKLDFSKTASLPPAPEGDKT